MKRQEALEQAHNYLKRGNTARKLKDRANNNADLTYMGLAHVIADVIQRGVNPKDVDFDKIDWGVSYGNIRGQAQDLADKKGGDEFGNEKRDRIESAMSKAEEIQKSRKHERLKDKAETVQRGRSKWAKYSDQTRNAETVYKAPITEDEYEKWRRDPNKRDIEGVDDRRPPSQRVNMNQFPFEKSIEKKKKEMMMKNVEEEPENTGFNVKSNREAVKRSIDSRNSSGMQKKNSLELTSKLDKLKDLKNVVGNKSDLQDSRSDKKLSFDVKGSTTERSTQKGLREMGMVSKSSEKTLDNFSFDNSNAGFSKEEIAGMKEKQGKDRFVESKGVEKSIFEGPSEAEEERKINTANWKQNGNYI